jgi:hypothetical protein
MHPLGGDQSEYPVIALAIAAMVAFALGFVWGERLTEPIETHGRIHAVFARVALWIVSFLVLGMVIVSTYRLFHPPQGGRHQGWLILPYLLSGLPLSLLVLFLGAFYSGTKRIIVVLSGGVMTMLYFFGCLDNINW